MSRQEKQGGRRPFLQRLMVLGGLAAVPARAQGQLARSETGSGYLPSYVRAQSYKSLKQSSFDKTGGNSDRWPIQAGQTLEIFQAKGPGMISHIWFTISAQSGNHLKELVLRVYWDGNAKPSVESPIGDFFGLNLGEYTIYESAYLACSPGRSLNCYFAMPYRTGARITVANEGKQRGTGTDDVKMLNIQQKVKSGRLRNPLRFNYSPPIMALRFYWWIGSAARRSKQLNLQKSRSGKLTFVSRCLLFVELRWQK